MPLVKITEEKQLRDLVNNQKKLVIGFFSPNCLKCQFAQPMFEQLGMNDVQTALVDITKNPEIAQAWKVTGTPTVVLCKFYKENKRVVTPTDAAMQQLFA